MATVNINSLDATNEESRAIRWARLQQDATLAAQVAEGDPPYVPFGSNKAYLEWFLATSIIPSLVGAEAASSTTLEDIRREWKDATDEQRAAALAALS